MIGSGCKIRKMTLKDEEPSISRWKSNMLLIFGVFAKCHITVEPIMFFFMFSIYLYLAFIELYFYQQFGLKALNDANSTDMIPNNSFCVNSSLLDDVLGNGTNDEVEGQTSFVILINNAPQFAISVVAALIAGPLSDKYGRKPALLFALIGNLIAALVNLLLVYFNMSVYCFIASSLLMGSTGGFTIIMTVNIAYLSDVSSNRWLTLRIGLLQAMHYSSQGLADIVTGQWLRRSGCDFNPVLWLALLSSVLAVLYLPFLKEPFTKLERNVKLKENGSTKLSFLFFRGFKIFISPKYSRWRLWFTVLTFIITVLNAVGTFEILTLFQLHKPLEWGPGEIGWYGLSNTLIQAFSLFCILPILIYFKVPDTLLVLVGLLISSGLNFFIGFLQTSWQMYLVAILSGLDPTVVPIIRSIFSKLVLQNDQGSLFAVVTGVQTLSSASSTVIYNAVFRAFVRRHMHPGLVFVLMGSVGLIPVPFIFWMFLKRNSATTPTPITDDKVDIQLTAIHSEDTEEISDTDEDLVTEDKAGLLQSSD